MLIVSASIRKFALRFTKDKKSYLFHTGEATLPFRNMPVTHQHEQCSCSGACSIKALKTQLFQWAFSKTCLRKRYRPSNSCKCVHAMQRIQRLTVKYAIEILPRLTCESTAFTIIIQLLAGTQPLSSWSAVFPLRQSIIRWSKIIAVKWNSWRLQFIKQMWSLWFEFWK